MEEDRRGCRERWSQSLCLETELDVGRMGKGCISNFQGFNRCPTGWWIIFDNNTNSLEWV